MRKAGAGAAEIARLRAHRVHEGNRPSSLLLYPQTTARSLGGLLALYEHSVFVQGTLWGINSFDQFGVELGKKLAAGISHAGRHGADRPGRAGARGTDRLCGEPARASLSPLAPIAVAREHRAAAPILYNRASRSRR